MDDRRYGFLSDFFRLIGGVFFETVRELRKGPLWAVFLLVLYAPPVIIFNRVFDSIGHDNSGISTFFWLLGTWFFLFSVSGLFLLLQRLIEKTSCEKKYIIYVFSCFGSNVLLWGTLYIISKTVPVRF